MYIDGIEAPDAVFPAASVKVEAVEVAPVPLPAAAVPALDTNQDQL